MLKKILWQEVTAIKGMPHNRQKLLFSATLRILLSMAVPFFLHSLTYSFHLFCTNLTKIFTNGHFQSFLYALVISCTTQLLSNPFSPCTFPTSLPCLQVTMCTFSCQAFGTDTTLPNIIAYIKVTAHSLSQFLQLCYF